MRWVAILRMNMYRSDLDSFPADKILRRAEHRVDQDIAPFAAIADLPLVMLVGPSFRAKTVPKVKFIAYATSLIWHRPAVAHHPVWLASFSK